MATFTPAELSKFPLDVLVNLIVPLLATQQKHETETQALDRWALDYAEWFARNRHRKLRDLPGFRPPGEKCQFLFHHADVESCSLEAFVILGAATDMPFSVFRQMYQQTEEDGGDPTFIYVRWIHYRRIMQGVVEPACHHKDVKNEERKGDMGD